MLVKWMRENVWAAALLLLARVYLGWQWMTAGWHKLAGDTAFDATGFLNNAVNKPIIDKATNEMIYPTFTSFVDHFALPNVKLINFLIPLGEFLVGLGLILGALTTAAAFFGLLMNFMFMFAGTVSTNPWLMLFGMIVMIGGANAGKFGADYYVLPLLRKLFTRRPGAGTKGHHPANNKMNPLPR